ncbi:hypothetical protein ACFQ07_09080 [Actinomadura adrarensis]|uniref:Core-binding (CB) domain-containing protein n=1 Tax=Actinomadura adrarensis TaxID=1819600 RepID=A0ABW3CEM4_9ACTN
MCFHTRKIAALRGDGVTLAAAADEFLSTHRVANRNTRRAYASAIDRTIEAVGGCDRLCGANIAHVGVELGLRGALRRRGGIR